MGELKKGSKGKDVEELQKLLNKAGAKPALKVDGIFGPITEGQVKAFQKKCKLAGDGKVGDTTMAAAKYGGPLPEMTVEDFKPKLAIYEKAKEVNEKSYKFYERIGQLVDALGKTVKSELPAAAAAIDANKVNWELVIDAAQKIVDIQKDFDKLRRKDPHKAKEQLDACRLQQNAVNLFGKRTSPNVEDLQLSYQSIRQAIDKTVAEIMSELDKSSKNNKEYKALL